MIDRVLSLLEQKHYTEVKETLLSMHEADIAEIFNEVDDREVMLRLFRLLPKDRAAETFAYLDGDVQQRLIEGVNAEAGHRNIADLVETRDAQLTALIKVLHR